MKNLFFIAILSVVWLSSCTNNFLEDSTTKIAKQNEQEILDYINRTSLKAQPSANGTGVYYVVTKSNPSGKSVVAGDEVSLNFKMTLFDGTLVDSSFNTKRASYIFGATNAIFGFLEATSLLKEGESGTFLIPSSQAWGTSPNGAVPANGCVRIDMKILQLRNEDQQIDDYVTTKKFTVAEKTSSGLRFISTKKDAAGTEIKSGNTVTVKYAGSLINDKQFDSGTFDVTIGAKAVIPGFEEAILKLKKGEAGKFILPSSIGYGKNGSGSTIPPYAPLIFDIEVTGVK
jgi:FKBP-type peptidyl-prolyl cis-trans isomerase